MTKGNHKASLIILAEANRATRPSFRWFDYLDACAPVQQAVFPVPANSILGCIRSLLRLRAHRSCAIIAIQNSRITRLVLLLSLMRIVKSPVVVLELNLKTTSTSRLRRWLIRILYSQAALIATLAPSDRDALTSIFRLNKSKCVVLKQWAQPEPFPESETSRMRDITRQSGDRYLVAAGRSSRNFKELFRALEQLPEARAVIVGLGESEITRALRGRVVAVECLSMEELVYLLRRAWISVIPLLPVQHTCGIRVWFQSVAMGIPVVITATEAVEYYAREGWLAELYPPGADNVLADKLRKLLRDEAYRAQLVSAARKSLDEKFSPVLYNREVADLMKNSFGQGNRQV